MASIKETIRKRMRLHRGRRVDNGIWVYGTPLADNIIVPRGQEFFPGENSLYTDSFTAYIVDPETVTEFTGLCDDTKWESLPEVEKERFFEWINTEYKDLPCKYVKDAAKYWEGRPIFEGDVVKLSQVELGVVFFKEGQFVVKVPNLGYSDSLSDRYRGSIVVGNAFDHTGMIEDECEGERSKTTEDTNIKLKLSETDMDGNIVDETVFSVNKEWLQRILGAEDTTQLEMAFANSDNWDAKEILRAARADLQSSKLKEIK